MPPAGSTTTTSAAMAGTLSASELPPTASAMSAILIELLIIVLLFWAREHPFQISHAGWRYRYNVRSRQYVPPVGRVGPIRSIGKRTIVRERFTTIFLD